MTALFWSTELARVRQAAQRRGLTVEDFLREAAIVVTDETLSSTRFESDPYAREDVETFPVPR